MPAKAKKKHFILVENISRTNLIKMMYLSDRKLLIVIIAIVAITLLMQIFVKRDEQGAIGFALPKFNLKTT